MNFKLSTKDFAEEILYHTMQVEASSNLRSLNLSPIKLSFGETQFKETALDLGSILQARYAFQKPVELLSDLQDDVIEMHFNLQHPIGLKERNQSKFTINPLQHNLLGLKNVSGSIDFSQGQFYETFDVHLKYDFLKKFYGQNPRLDAFIDSFERHNISYLYPISQAISPMMLAVIRQIANCPFEGLTKNVFLEGKVLELFALQLQQLDESSVIKNTQLKLSKKDYECLRHAKFYIENNLMTPKSILELARICGINQQKLKVGFSTLFGTTVFGYLQSCRMNKAKEMLLEGALLTDVFMLVGYKNYSNFSAAFKQHFGYAPSALLKEVKAVD